MLRTLLDVPKGEAGFVSLFNSSKALTVAKHLTAERLVPVGKQGNKQWQLDQGVTPAGRVKFSKPTRANHYLDATVYAFAAAIKAGVQFQTLRRHATVSEDNEKRKSDKPQQRHNSGGFTSRGSGFAATGGG